MNLSSELPSLNVQDARDLSLMPDSMLESYVSNGGGLNSGFDLVGALSTVCLFTGLALALWVAVDLIMAARRRKAIRQALASLVYDGATRPPVFLKRNPS